MGVSVNNGEYLFTETNNLINLIILARVRMVIFLN